MIFPLLVLLIAGMWSRSRCLSLETVSRRTNVSSRSHLGQSAQHLGLVLVSDQYFSGLVSVLAQNFSASHLGLGLFHVVSRDILCGMRAVRQRGVVIVVPYRPICLSP